MILRDAGRDENRRGWQAAPGPPVSRPAAAPLV